MKIVFKIIAIIVALVIIITWLAPLLTSMFPPFGKIILALCYLSIVAYILDWTPIKFFRE